MTNNTNMTTPCDMFKISTQNEIVSPVIKEIASKDQVKPVIKNNLAYMKKLKTKH